MYSHTLITSALDIVILAKSLCACNAELYYCLHEMFQHFQPLSRNRIIIIDLQSLEQVRQEKHSRLFPTWL
jgi:hypothetical protein